MGDSPVPEPCSPAGFDRRTALKRGALVGGALVWAVPVVQAVSLTSAHAENPSAPPPNNPPPEQPPNNPPPNNPPGGQVPPNNPPTQGQPFAPPPGSATPTTPGSKTGQLAFTGPGLPVVPTVAVAASLIATGAAAQAVGRRRSPDGEPGPGYDQPEQNPAG